MGCALGQIKAFLIYIYIYNAAALPSPTVGTFAKERKRGRSNWWVLWFPEDPKTFCSPSRPRDPKSFLLPGPIGPGKSTSGWLPGSHPPTKRGYELFNFAKRPSPWATGDINEGQLCQASMYRTKNALPRDHGKAPKKHMSAFLGGTNKSVGLWTLESNCDEVTRKQGCLDTGNPGFTSPWLIDWGVQPICTLKSRVSILCLSRGQGANTPKYSTGEPQKGCQAAQSARV